MSRVLFAVIAALFAGLGLLSSVWISHAVLTDSLHYGDDRWLKWRVLDPAAAYISDAAFFLEPGEVECNLHPGLTLGLVNGALLKACYYLSSPLLGWEDYDTHLVRHCRFYLFLCSFVSTLLFVACCRPLFLICRGFMPGDLALTVCSLFLTSVPVLVFINRFAPEPYCLFFGLWSVCLALQTLRGRGDRRVWVLMGLCLALSVLAKPLMLAVAALHVYALLAHEPLTKGWAKRTGVRLLLYAVPAAVLTCVLVDAKLPVEETLNDWDHDIVANRNTTVEKLWLRVDQRPFLQQNLVLFLLAAAGARVALWRPDLDRRSLAALALTLLLLMVSLLRRPDWHYFFGFTWGWLLLAALGVHTGLTRLARVRPAVAAPLTFVLLLTVSSWRYPGLVVTFSHMHANYAERRELLARAPYALPAPWEDRVGSANVPFWPVASPRLQAALTRLRQQWAADHARQAQ